MLIYYKERRAKDHIRSINKLSVSHVVHHYCITGSSDGDLRVWVSFYWYVNVQKKDMNVEIGLTGFKKVYHACSPPHICS